MLAVISQRIAWVAVAGACGQGEYRRAPDVPMSSQVHGLHVPNVQLPYSWQAAVMRDLQRLDLPLSLDAACVLLDAWPVVIQAVQPDPT